MALTTGRADEPAIGASVATVPPEQPAPVIAEPEGPAKPEEPGTRPDERRVYVLDLLRFLAAMSVLSFHFIVDAKGTWGADPAGLFTTTVRDIAKYGWLGVECFFVISGFVICMSSWGRSVATFFTSRVSRLMPAYIFAVLLTSGVLTLWPLAEGRPDFTHVLYHLTLLHTFLNIPDIDSAYWTLFIELKFYLLFTIVVHFGLTYRRVVLFCVLWTVAALFAQFAGPWQFFVVVEPRFDNYFVAGITLYLMHRYGPNLLLWCILGTSMILSLYSLYDRVKPFNVQTHFMSFPVAVAIMFCFFLTMIAVSLGWLSRLRWRGMVVLGALTYPLYLTHAQLSRVVITHFHRAVPPVLLLCLMVVGALALAYVVHRLVERPVSGYLKRGLQASFAKIRAADLREPVARR